MPMAILEVAGVMCKDFEFVTNKKYINDNWEESNVKYIKDLTY